jgi:predicted ATPase
MIAEEGGRWKLRVGIEDVEGSVPTSIRQLIERQIDRLTADEREVLDGASVGGMEFSTRAIAAGIGKPMEWVEERCEELARRHQFLSAAWMDELPDGTITPRHRFVHVLYRDVPYHLLRAMRRSQIHHRIAESEAEIYGARNSEIAAELAMHFEQSRDWERALEHIIQAASNASWKSAHHEAAELARRGLTMQKSLPRSAERDQQEITLRTILSASLMAVKGFASVEVEQVYTDGKQLFDQGVPSPRLFNVLYLHGISMMVGGKVRSALGIAERLLVLGEELKDPALEMEARRLVGSTLQKMGRCREALDHLERASHVAGENMRQLYPQTIGHDFKAPSECCASAASWALGFPDTALQQVQEGLAHARKLSHAQSLVAANHYAAQLHQFRGETALARERAEELIEVARQYGFEPWLAFGKIYLGCAEVKLGRVQQGIDRIKEGMTAYSATGGKLWSPYFLSLLADALGLSKRADEGLVAIEEAIKTAEVSEELFAIAELYRLKGELLLKSNPVTEESRAEARGCFAKALETSRKQQLRSWELRALISIHCHRTNEIEQDVDLAACYNSFTEGFETEDLRRAAVRLGRL